jgi:hypothetical protein
LGGFGCGCAAGGPEFRAGAGAVDVEGGRGGGLFAIDPEGERCGEGVVGGAHDDGRRVSGWVFAAVSVEEEAVWRFEWRIVGRHAVSIGRPNHVLRH